MEDIKYNRYNAVIYEANPNKTNYGLEKADQCGLCGSSIRLGQPLRPQRTRSSHGSNALFQVLDEKLEKDPTFLDPLRGNDLMCYCPLDENCHTDILLKKIEATNVGVVVTENKTPKNCEPVREGEMAFVVLNNGSMKMVSGMVKSGDIKCPTCGDKSGTLMWSCCHTPIENSVPIAEKQLDELDKSIRCQEIIYRAIGRGVVIPSF